jgi:hypothetical protein
LRRLAIFLVNGISEFVTIGIKIARDSNVLKFYKPSSVRAHASLSSSLMLSRNDSRSD